MAIFLPSYGTINAPDLAKIFISHVFSKQGLPVSIVGDRGSLFVSSLWTQLCQQLKISRDLSTAFHPETDGQTERVNQILEHYLQIYVSYLQDDWHTWLPLGEFAYNNAEHSSITQLPLSRNFDSILVVVERFSKMAIFIPTYSTITSLDLADIFISHVFSKHGFPISIVSDRGSLFVSSLWTQLTAQDIKSYLDCLSPWNRWTDREGKSDSRTVSLDNIHQQNSHQFLTTNGRNNSFDSIHISQHTPAGRLSTKLQSVQKVVKEELEAEIKRFKKYADRNRASPRDFQPGDKVWLASKNIKTTRPTKKLSESLVGPFEVLKKIGSHAYNLKLPQK
ncbi:hypothetical protein O181_064906 [Austropuccinia psidii MF-1]|uniref:Integrase catalytic domain-containing protein n=1 Tax=Austropuccinia psidii MF-1 TaxID=1389203 RepID=A0A9Q3I0R9_9BASI|nr:hypothetical protein [Austropuccinia psidii MF-1]